MSLSPSSARNVVRQPVGRDPVDVVLERLRRGGMVVIEDADSADVAVAGTFVTANDVNFMAHEARGLICVALSDERCRSLGLQLLPRRPSTRMNGPPFTVSIEARHGITTGISASDRAHTIRVAARLGSSRGDLVRPGHIFPLRAHHDRVLGRRSKPDAEVDLAILAELPPAAATCAILDEQGDAASEPVVREFCHRHDLPRVSVDAVARYRRDRARGSRADGPLDDGPPAAPPDGGAQPHDVSPQRFAAIMSGLASGVSIVTTLDEHDAPKGLTSTAVCSVSADPPLLSICLDRTSRTLPALLARGAFVVNLVASSHLALCARFASSADDKFTGLPWTPGPEGIPVLSAHAIAWAACRTARTVPAGDHVLILGRVVDGAQPTADADPIVYLRQRYGRWSALS